VYRVSIDIDYSEQVSSVLTAEQLFVRDRWSRRAWRIASVSLNPDTEKRSSGSTVAPIHSAE
jgi:hypothetical protein